MSWDWRIFTNPYVSSLGFDFGEVAFSAGDYLKIASFEQLTSAPGGWRDYAISGTGQSGVNMRVYTDATVGGAGFTMSQARILCSAGGSSTTPLIYPLERAEGVLAGTHDAIYFMLPGSTAATYISLQGVPATSDFDLYLGRNALPTSAGFFSRAVSISSSEALVIPATSSADTWYLVVHSWNGAGSFRLRFSRVKTGEALALSAGFDHIPTTAEVDALSASLGRGMRRFFGMTEGQVLVTSIDIFRNGSCSNCNGSACHICSRSGSGRPNSTVGGCQAGGSGRINLYPNDPAYLPYTDLILAHELGHCALSLPDEYADHGVCHTDDKCSHSMMSSALYYRSWNLCLDFDHGKDSVPSGHVCTSCTASGLCTATCNACTEPSSVWFRLQAAGRVTDVPVSTPDNESFADEPGFGALMSIVVH